MFNRILVPLDGSAFAELAIPHAEQFARIFGANIVLLRVLDVLSYQENVTPIDPLKWQIRKTEAEIYLKELAEKVQKRLSHYSFKNGEEDKSGSKRVQYAIREGRVAENIVNFAQAEKIDLVVICTHGMGGLSRWNISSVTHKVISLIYLPVLIVRAYNEMEIQPEIHHYQRILIPVDSSRRAECVFSTGIAIREGQATILSELKNEQGGPQTTTLLLVSVIKPPELPIPEPYSDEIKQLQAQFLQLSRKAVKNYLDSIKNHLSGDCETLLLENQSVPTAIQELAEKEKIDLILMSAHGYGGQFNYPYGSIVRHTIEHGSAPVLIIQDIPLSQVKPTQAEIAVKKYGSR